MGAGKEATAIQTGRSLTDRSLLGRRAGWGSLGLWLGSQWSWGGGNGPAVESRGPNTRRCREARDCSPRRPQCPHGYLRPAAPRRRGPAPHRGQGEPQRMAWGHGAFLRAVRPRGLFSASSWEGLEKGGRGGPDTWSKHVVGGPGDTEACQSDRSERAPRQSWAAPRRPISNPRSRRARARRPVRSLYARRAVVPAASRQETGGRRHQLPAPCALRGKRPCWALGGSSLPKPLSQLGHQMAEVCRPAAESVFGKACVTLSTPRSPLLLTPRAWGPLVPGAAPPGAGGRCRSCPRLRLPWRGPPWAWGAAPSTWQSGRQPACGVRPGHLRLSASRAPDFLQQAGAGTPTGPGFQRSPQTNSTAGPLQPPTCSRL